MKEDLTLVEINAERKNDAFRWDEISIHNYLPFYDKLFIPFRYKKINIFEVGYSTGGSSRLWERYFPYAKIKSIDIGLNLSPPPPGRITFEVININDITSEYFADFIPDIAIDDGSHLLEEQIYFINIIYPILKCGGLLIIEDIQDIDNQKAEFDKLNIKYEIIDQRSEQGRYDEVLLIFRKK